MSGRSTSRDTYGWKRGLGAYSKDDRAFGNPSRTYDNFKVKPDHELSLIDDQVDQPAGKLLGGGGPVSHNKRTRGVPRFKGRHGPIGNLAKPK